MQIRINSAGVTKVQLTAAERRQLEASRRIATTLAGFVGPSALSVVESIGDMLEAIHELNVNADGNCEDD